MLNERQVRRFWGYAQKGMRDTHHGTIECMRCHERKPYHLTRYGVHGEGCLPLCRDCWLALGTAHAREPYYRMLWGLWLSSADCRWPRRVDDDETQRSVAAIFDKWPLIVAGLKAEESPPAADAGDPHAADTGRLSTRDK